MVCLGYPVFIKLRIDGSFVIYFARSSHVGIDTVTACSVFGMGDPRALVFMVGDWGLFLLVPLS